MEDLKLDCGIREYALGSGVLRFNPGDPNLYARFLAAAEQLPELEGKLIEEAGTMENNAQGLLRILTKADGQMKALLTDVFPGNDFEKLLEGVNLLAVASNGERIITNLLQTLEPILQAGAEAFAQTQTEQAVEKARQRRAGV